MTVGVLLILMAVPACKSSSAGGSVDASSSGGAGGTLGTETSTGGVGEGGAGVGGTAGGDGDAREPDGTSDQAALGDDANPDSPPDAATDSAGAPPLPPMVWTQRTSTTTRALHGLASSGDTVVVVGESVILTSRDGVDWTSQTFPTSSSTPSQFEHAAYGAGMFVIGGGQSQLMASPDGVTWTVPSTPVASRWNGVTFAAGRFFVTSSDFTGGRYIDSPDGLTWTSHQVAADLQDDWLFAAVFSANDVLFASSSRYPARSFLSLDAGTTWQRISAWTVLSYDAAFGNGRYCVGATYDTAHTSRDALAWSDVSVYGGSLHGMTFATDRFVCVGSFGFLQISTDCLTWSEGSNPPIADQVPSNTSFNSVRVHKDKVIVVGDNGVILTAPLP